MKIACIATAVAGLLWMGACRPVKKIQTAVSQKDTTVVVSIAKPGIDSAAIKKQILERIHSNHIGFDYFSAKIKVDYFDAGGKKTNANCNVRIKKDEVIWLSLTGPLGIEGYRILVKPDSVIIMNKLEKEVRYRSVAYLKDVANLPVDFFTLQDILIGNPVFFSNNIVSFRQTGGNLMALSMDTCFKHMITLDTASNTVQHSKLDDVNGLRNRTCDINLDKYQQLPGNRLFSVSREITVAEKSKLEVKLDYKQVSFDEPQTFPFNIPKSYLRK